MKNDLRMLALSLLGIVAMYLIGSGIIEVAKAIARCFSS